VLISNITAHYHAQLYEARHDYTKAALVGIAGDLEHGAPIIHPRLGMAMRRAIKRGRVERQFLAFAAWHETILFPRPGR